MVGKKMDSKSPVEVCLGFSPAICTGGICPCPGVEAPPDLRVIFYRIQQREHEVVRPSGFTRQ